jgi:thioredoxin 2
MVRQIAAGASSWTRAGLESRRREDAAADLDAVTSGPQLAPVIVDCASCSRSNRLPAARLLERARCAACKASLLPIERPITVHDVADFDELIRDAKAPVLVDFWAAWCGPCRAVAPEVEKLARAQRGRLIAAKVDTDAQPELSARYGIRSIPTLVVFRNGREAKRVSGAMPASAMAVQLELE